MVRECVDGAHLGMADTDKPRWPITPMSDAGAEAADSPRPATASRDDPPRRDTSDAPGSDDSPHGPGGMDAIDDEPVRAPDDDDAPGGMTGIPDPEDT
jgi:hypothetical protein